jgi:nucleoid-associated protein YgaU
MEAGNRIVAAVSQSPSNQLNGDVVKKSIKALQELLLPEEAERTAQQADKAKEILAKEMAGGPIRFRPQSQSKPKGRKRR